MKPRNSTSTTQGEDVTVWQEAHYKSLLPNEVVHWSLYESPVCWTYASLYRVYQQFGDRTLEVLKGAMQLDLEKLLERQFKTSHIIRY